MSTSVDMSIRDLGCAKPVHESELYSRYCLTDPDVPFFAQILTLPSSTCDMTVQADKEALDVDFRYESTRPDVPGVLRERPGFRIARELAVARHLARPRVLFNGNNVGYWGNQFVVEGGTLTYKERGPIFDDGNLVRHASGSHLLFCRYPGRFAIEQFEFSFRPTPASDAIQLQEPLRLLPGAGLSGFPLVRSGLAIWSDHLATAWDPRLLYEGSRLTGVDRTYVLELIRERWEAGKALARHAMTLIGVDGSGDGVLVVVEQSMRSRGISLAEAARLMVQLGATDALALGAAGDAQLATTEEGFLTAPLIASHVRAASREVPRRLRSPAIDRMEAFARPVPCLVAIDWNAGWPTEVLPVTR